MRDLRPGAKGADVKALQLAINQRGRTPRIKVDGEYGPDTHNAAAVTARALGALESTIDLPGTTIGEQRIIRWPSRRTPAQLARARDRKAATAKAAKEAAKRNHGANGALAEARKYTGKTESPAGSNMAPWGLTAWIKHFLGLDYGVPWCGIFVGHCLEKAGVKVTSRVASVALIHEDAGAGRNGFIKRVGVRDGQPGDAVGLFGLSTHVALIEKRVPGGYQTIEGNTSSGNAGSQANGGGCFRRFRPYSAVVYVARPHYPSY